MPSFVLKTLSCLLLTSSVKILTADALECYSCSNIHSVNECNETTHCQNGESCFLNISSHGYQMGCSENEHCGSLSSAVISMVGRSVPEQLRTLHKTPDRYTGLGFRALVAKRNMPHCFECCSSDVCNIHLCQHLKPTACIDDARVDCAWMNSKFNICANVHEAKSVCPKFCGFCTLVDGGWNNWSSWTTCDTTCGNGTQTRTRDCNKPPPVNGGLFCQGSATDIRSCNHPPCPVMPTVVFQSHGLSSTSVRSNQIFVFTTNTMNIGEGYNNKTGKFTAPVQGTYSFSAQFCMSPATSVVSYAFVQNSTDLDHGQFAGNQYNYGCHNTHISTLLRLNESLWIESRASSSYLYEDSNMWNLFSGHLVHI